MGRVIRHYELPEASTNSVTDASSHFSGKSFTINFDYYKDDSKAYRSSLCFKGTVSTRFRSERCCTSRHIKAFDVLTEIIDSEWIVSQRSDIAERYHDEFNVHHFMIYFDSVGCFEILAESYEVMPEEAGSWDSFRSTT